MTFQLRSLLVVQGKQEADGVGNMIIAVQIRPALRGPGEDCLAPTQPNR